MKCEYMLRLGKKRKSGNYISNCSWAFGGRFSDFSHTTPLQKKATLFNLYEVGHYYFLLNAIGITSRAVKVKKCRKHIEDSQPAGKWRKFGR